MPARVSPRRSTSATIAALLALFALPWSHAARAAEPPDSSRARLAPTASPPWNPPRAVTRAQPWETVVRAPGRLVSLPISLLGMGVKQGLIFVEDNDVVPKVSAQVSVLADYGVVAGPASLGDHTGLGAELGINPTFFRSLLVAVSGSTLGYNRERVALQAPMGSIEYRSDWRSGEPFYGFGADTRKDDASDFALQSQMVRVELRHPFKRAAVRTHELLEDPAASTETHAPPRHLFRVWAGPRDLIQLDGRETTSGRQPLTVRFPALASEQLGTRIEHFVYGGQASYDTRSGRPHWWKGWRAAVTGERFDRPLQSFAFQSASTPTFSFTRLTYEGEMGVSFWRDPRTLRLYGRVVDQTTRGSGGLPLVYDLSTLGGQQGLAGFEPGRFRGPDLALGRLSYIFPIARYLETDVHAELGNVAGRIEELRLDDLESSFGVAIRIRNAFAPLAYFGVERSRETVRLRFGIGGVE